MAANGRTALITGAGKNIGRACAHVLAQDGFNVVINGSSDRAACDRVAEECQKLGAKALVIMGDVGKLDECKRIAAEAAKAFGNVDALINNAALRPSKPFLETTEEEWQRVLSVDLEGAVRLSRACLPGRVQKGWGRIVNVIGSAGRQVIPNYLVGGAANAALINFTKGLSDLGAKHGIFVKAASPGAVATERWENRMKLEAKAEGRSYEDVRARGSLAREYTVTYRDTLEPNERIVAGQFWRGPAAEPEVSVEKGINERTQ